MNLHRDLREFLQLLNSNHVEYLLVGGYALAAHGHVRFTKDIDFWVDPSASNAEKIISVLRQFGFDDVGSAASTLTSPDGILTLGRSPARIDLLTSIPGVEFEIAWKRRIETQIDGVDATVICREDLVKAKLASRRLQDLADLQELGIPESLIPKQKFLE